MVTGQDIVASARKLVGAAYRQWYSGNPVPMWLYDQAGDPPDAEHMLSVGCMCSDLLNWACEDNGLAAIGGTGAWADAIVDWQPFDPSTPGEVGAVAVKGYQGPYAEGHILLFTGPHSAIQSLVSPGVTEDYTDAETYAWGGETAFDWYGRIPGVTYGEAAPAPPVPVEDCAWIGWDKNGKPVANGADCSRGWRWVADL
jgi:hypothetical protein